MKVFKLYIRICIIFKLSYYNNTNLILDHDYDVDTSKVLGVTLYSF